MLASGVAGQSSGVSWMAEGSVSEGHFGQRVASAGDVNGDGYGDVLVGAPWATVNFIREGRVALYLGGAGGLDTEAAWEALGGADFAAFGDALVGGFDVNGDGYDDVLVGSPHLDLPGMPNAGRASLFLGSAGGLSLSADWEVFGRQTSASLGAAVGGAGDVNGDGFDDVIVGAPLLEAGGEQGRAFVFHGSPTGLGAAPDWTGSPGVDTARYGSGVSGVGDVNGDGFDDVAVGAPGYGAPFPFEGRALVYLGSAGGLSPSPAWTRDGSEISFGAHVAAAGDVNADGFDDLLVGEDGYDKQTLAGAVYLFLGSAAGPGLSSAWQVGGTGGASFPGLSFVGAGDVEGDGYDDLVVGAPDHGRVYVHRGSAGGPSITPDWEQGTTPNDDFGAGVALADVDGDGYADLVTGAPRFRRCGTTGRAYLFAGCSGAECDFGVHTYCESHPTSVDAGARIGFSGSLEVPDNDFHLTAGCVPGETGLFFYGGAPTSLPFGDGELCVAASGGLFRLSPPAVPTGDTAVRQVDFTRHPASGGASQVLPGSTWYFQYWFRDPKGPGGSTFNLSDGLAVTFR